MTEEAVATESPMELHPPYAPGAVWAAFALICLVCGGLLAAFGVHQAFSSEVTRGLVLVSAGGVLVLGAIAQLLLALRAQLAVRLG